MVSGFVHLPDKDIHYVHAGTGKRLLLCFHGYGSNAYFFRNSLSYLTPSFTIVSVDLPHHGKTKCAEDALLSKDELKKIIETLLHSFHQKTFSLFGYSIGGRICLCAVELFPMQVEQCVLAASDGLSFHPFYHFVTGTTSGSKLFKRFLSDEKNLRFIEAAKRYKLIAESKYRFVLHYLKTQEDRKKLQQIWHSLSLLVPHHRHLRNIIAQQSLPVQLFMGKRDTVIPLQKARKFIEGLPTVHLTVLDKGHRLLDEETLPLITQTLINR